MVLAVLLAAPFAEVAGQQVTLRPGPTNAVFRLSADIADGCAAAWTRDSVSYPRTYWVEGGLVGGLALGTLSALVAGALCGDPDSGDISCGPAVLGGLLLGGALGFTVGALVGGSVSKPPTQPASPGGVPAAAGRGMSGRLLGTAILVPTGMAVGLTTSNSFGGALVGGLTGFAVGQFLGTLIDRQAAPAGAQ